MSDPVAAEEENFPSPKQVEDAEKQIRALQTDVDYDTREYPVGVVVSKYLEGLAEDENELFIPDYQPA